MRAPQLSPEYLDHGRTDDLVQPFQIDRYGLRGRLVRLGDTVDAVLRRHDYPEPVARLLGEALVLAACLASSVKYDGIFTLQARGQGALSLLVVDVTSDGAMRGYAGFDAAAVRAALEQDPTPTAARLFGGGHLAFTVDQGRGDGQRYQGIVELQGASLADCVHHYFRQSEQIDTAIKVACGPVAVGGGPARWRAGALMVQRLPEQAASGGGPDAGSESAEGWHRAVVFLGSATTAEMLDPGLTPRELLFRLFHEDGVRVYRPRLLEERCRCGRRRVEEVLAALPRAEVERLREADDAVVVTCQFCNRAERFTDADLDRLYG